MKLRIALVFAGVAIAAAGAGIYLSHWQASTAPFALTEWHKRIPDYEIATEEQLYERGAQLSINKLPLRWEI